MTCESPFYKEEYAALRKEIEMILAEHTQLRFYCVIALAAVISWNTTHTYSTWPAACLAWIVVVAMPAVAAYSAMEKQRHLARIATYIRKIERHYLDKDGAPEGWEHFHASKTSDEKAFADKVFWCGLICFSLLVAAVGIWDVYT